MVQNVLTILACVSTIILSLGSAKLAHGKWKWVIEVLTQLSKGHGVTICKKCGVETAEICVKCGTQNGV